MNWWYLQLLVLCLLGSSKAGPLSSLGPAALAPEEKAIVYVVEHPKATMAFTPQSTVVQEMVDRGLKAISRNDYAAEAWNTLLTPEDVVGIKVYSSPGKNSGTRPIVVEAIITSLLKAGFSPQNIVIWDRRLSDLRGAGYGDLAERFGAKLAGSLEAGYDDATFYEAPLLGKLVYGDHEFGRRGEGIGRKSYVSKLLTQQITKIISVSPLLNHNQAGVSGALFSLTFGSVDNILRFDFDGEKLATAIPEIYALPEIGDRVVLNVVDALICQYQGEESTLLHYATGLNQLWFSRDPVAVDVLALQALAKERALAKHPSPRLNLGIYHNAEIMDIGKADLKKIQVEKILLR